MKRNLLFSFPAISVTQPIGTFYVTSMQSDDLSSIAFADVRRLDTSTTAIEEYLGIQRTLSATRRKDIGEYVQTGDATFPTSIVIAVEDERCLEYDEAKHTISFFEVKADEDGPAIERDSVARILDGQHRLAGLKAGERIFGLPVTVFPAIDMAEQAYIFATVNIAQTKVNTSLAYDLLAYARSRSPERTCHDVAVALNDAAGSPFYKKIKRLGSRTAGVVGETLSQATFVMALLPYISRKSRTDREDLRNGVSLPLVTNFNQFQQTPLRNLFIEERDAEIVDILWDYFDSIRQHWNDAWKSEEPGQIIKRTNGFRAFMNVFGEAYLAVGGSNIKRPTSADYEKIWAESNVHDEHLNRENFLPGTSGERNLTKSLQSALAVYRRKRNASPSVA